jgi:hypothetical protein
MRNKKIISDYMSEKNVSGEVLPPFELPTQTMQYIHWLEKKYLQARSIRVLFQKDEMAINKFKLKNKKV